MGDYCRGCLKEIKFGEKGTCWHEAGYGHHLSCPINPEHEDEVTDLVKSDLEAKNSPSNPPNNQPNNPQE